MQLGILNRTDCHKTRAVYQGRASALPKNQHRKGQDILGNESAGI